MSSSSLWDRLRQARVVQILIVYLGASWGVLQIADTLTEALALPEWVAPVTIILLLAGFVIILATAWVQSLPSTTAAEEAGEIPTDWEIAPGAAVESLKLGKLPHLTWGRAVLGGIVVLSLLFGGTGLWVTITGGPGVMGPAEVGAADIADGIAILPFRVSGIEDEAFWGESMVDLLSTNLDGMGGYRTIDSRTVLARWREHVGDETSPDLSAALTAAGETGARFAVVGSANGVGGDLRLVAEIYDLASGDEIGSGQVEGSIDEPLRMIDDLSLRIGSSKGLSRPEVRRGGAGGDEAEQGSRGGGGRRGRESVASERRELGVWYWAAEMRGWAGKALGGASPAGRLDSGASEVEVVGRGLVELEVGDGLWLGGVEGRCLIEEPGEEIALGRSARGREGRGLVRVPGKPGQ